MTDSNDPANESIWQRLRRRKLVQWGIAYSAVAWGLLQVLEYVSDTFDWPRQIQQIATLGLLIGLPLVLVIAWYHGDRGEQRVSRSELAILSILFLLGGTAVWLYGRSGEVAPNATSEPAALASHPTDARPSIAVLPFANRSDRHEDTYFVDGIQDDILTQLAKVGALKVIARTSSEQFRGTTLTIREIGAKLGVATVVEGGVQRASDRVRITVQLIDTATDAHLWAENYDRELTASNIFAVQSEVAKAIAEALKAALTPAEKARIDTVPTQNLAAWEAYQLGKQALDRRTGASLAEAQQHFQSAIDQDRQFALAYAGLADAIWLEADHGGRPLAPAVARAEAMLGQALQLDPDLAEARATLAKFAQQRREFERAESLYTESIELNPNQASVRWWYAQLLFITGRDAEALQSLRKAVELDPLSVFLQTTLGWVLSGFGRFDEAIAAFEKARSIDPSSPLPYSGIGTVQATALGHLAEAVPMLQKAVALDPNSNAFADLGYLYLDLGDEAGLRRMLDRTGTDRLPSLLGAAYSSLYTGKQEAVVELARRAIEVDPRNAAGLVLLRDADLENDAAAAARTRYATAFPELLGPDDPAIDPSNYRAAIDLALVLQATAEPERAAALLDGAEAILRTSPRLGPFGYGVADAQILALKGRSAEALQALRNAVSSGWRGPLWRYYRDFDPELASIRAEPEFRDAFAEIERDMARQRTELARLGETKVPSQATQ